MDKPNPYVFGFKSKNVDSHSSANIVTAVFNAMYVTAGAPTHSCPDQARAKRGTPYPAQSATQEQPCHGGGQERGHVL